mgnify:FL=1
MRGSYCSWLTEDGETEEHWFDVRALRMLSPFDVEKFTVEGEGG